jgi:hypothetical protein
MTVRRLVELGAVDPADEDRARDSLWVLNSVQVWDLLRRRGFSGDEYAEWVGEAMVATVLGGRADDGPSG